MTSAQIICDSVARHGHRLTTIEVVMHRFVLAEFNTHRAFSRNSASSRAIPLRKQIERVMHAPAFPLSWPQEQPGMQGGEEIEDPLDCIDAWLDARDYAVDTARRLQSLGVHKSLCNRLLEPFMWHTVIVTATEWDGFWRQRCSPLAMPEIRVAAEAMKEAYDASTPVPVDYGKWHLPFISPVDVEWAKDRSRPDYLDLLRAISAARCARVSYLTHDGVRDPEVDLDLYDKLVSAEPPHASPLEHVATPARMADVAAGDIKGNFVGWEQSRHMVLKF